MTETLAPPPKAIHNFRRVAILFAGGPAPGANAVISTAAISFLRNDCEVIGMKHGYSSLVGYDPSRPLEEGRDWLRLTPGFMKRSRSSQGILIGTARANPGRLISSPAHFDEPERVQPLKNVYDGLRSLGVEALISIGGDDTLKTANKFKLHRNPRAARGFRWSTCPRRSTTTTWASTSPSAISPRSTPWPTRFAT